MVALSPDLTTEWEGGSLGELVSTLQAAALPARIEVIPPGSADGRAGEIHLLAGGLADAFAGTLRRDEAVAALQRLEGARYVVVTCLPDPATGSLASPGPHEGSLKDRSVATLMRYCEEYVLTCRLEVWRGQERAVVDYRRGEIVGSLGSRQRRFRTPARGHGLERRLVPDEFLPAPTLPSSPRKSKAQVAEPALPDEWEAPPDASRRASLRLCAGPRAGSLDRRVGTAASPTGGGREPRSGPGQGRGATSREGAAGADPARLSSRASHPGLGATAGRLTSADRPTCPGQGGNATRRPAQARGDATGRPG